MSSKLAMALFAVMTIGSTSSFAIAFPSSSSGAIADFNSDSISNLVSKNSPTDRRNDPIVPTQNDPIVPTQVEPRNPQGSRDGDPIVPTSMK